MRANLSLAILAFTIGTIGCRERSKPVSPGTGSGKNTNQRETYMPGDHGHHHPAFADPQKCADRWNNPQRNSWQHPEEIIAALALSPGATVADIGAGTGYMVAHLSGAIGERGTVLAIDSEAAMIEYLRARSKDLGPATIVPRKVGAESADLQKESVDAAVTLNTWHHIAGRPAYAKKVYEGLKRGGRFVIVDAAIDAETGPPQEMRIEPAQVIKELEAGGFRAELSHETMPQHYMVVGHKD